MSATLVSRPTMIKPPQTSFQARPRCPSHPPPPHLTHLPTTNRQGREGHLWVPNHGAGCHQFKVLLVLSLALTHLATLASAMGTRGCQTKNPKGPNHTTSGSRLFPYLPPTHLATPDWPVMRTLSAKPRGSLHHAEGVQTPPLLLPNLTHLSTSARAVMGTWISSISSSLTPAPPRCSLTWWFSSRRRPRMASVPRTSTVLPSCGYEQYALSSRR